MELHGGGSSLAKRKCRREFDSLYRSTISFGYLVSTVIATRGLKPTRNLFDSGSTALIDKYYL